MYQRIYLILLFHLPLCTESDVVLQSPLCDQHIHLSDVGHNSTVLLKMTPPPDGGGFCKVNISAPKDHFLLVSFTKMDTADLETSEASARSCNLTIQYNAKSFMEVDLCRPEVPSYVSQLLRRKHIRLWWDHQNNTAIIAVRVTVITNGKNCTKDEYHPISKSGKFVIFCISKELACDGVQHILNTNFLNDEDIEFCNKLKNKTTEVKTSTIDTTAEDISKDANDVETRTTNDDIENTSEMQKDNKQDEKNERVAITNEKFGSSYLFLRVLGCTFLLVIVIIVICFLFTRRRESQERRRSSIDSQAPLEQQLQDLLPGKTPKKMTSLTL